MNHISNVYPEVKTIAINEAEGQSFFKKLVGFFWSDAAANSDDPAQKRMAEEMKLRQDFIEQDQKDIEKRREDLLKAQHEARMEALKAQHKLKKMQLDAKNKEKVEYFKQKAESLKRQRENMASSMFPLSESTKQAMLNKLQGEIDSLDSLGAKKTMTAEENAAFNVFNAMVKKDNDGNVITNEYGDPELVDSKDYQTNLAKNLTLPPMNMTKEEAEKEAANRVSAAIGESGKALNAMTPEESKTLFNELREMGNKPSNKELSERLNKINDLQNNPNFTKMEEAKNELDNIEKLKNIKQQLGGKNIDANKINFKVVDNKLVPCIVDDGNERVITDPDTLKKLGLKEGGIDIEEGTDIEKLKSVQTKKARTKANALLADELADLDKKEKTAKDSLNDAAKELKDSKDKMIAALGLDANKNSDEINQITKQLDTLTNPDASAEEKSVAQASLTAILDKKKESIKNEIEENKSALAQMQSGTNTAGAALRNKDAMSDDELEDALRNNSVETKEWPDMNAIDDNDPHKKAHAALIEKAEKFPEDSEERAKYLAAANAVKQDYISSQNAEEPSFKVGNEEIKGKLVKTKDGFAIKTPDGETKAFPKNDGNAELKAALQQEAEYREKQKKIAASKSRTDVECHVAEDGTLEIMTADIDDNGKPVKDSKPSFISVKDDNINDSNEGNFNKAGDHESKQELEKTDNSEESYTSEDGKERITKYKENGEWKYKKETKSENGEWADDTTTSDDDIKAQFNELKSADDATANDDGKEGKDPSKYWKQRPKKNGKGKTESYYSQGGRGDVSISKKEYLEKVNKYNKKQKAPQATTTTDNNSLQVFINNSLVFESRTNNSGLKDFIKRMIAESKEQSKDEKKQKPESTEPEEINNKGAYKLGNSVFFTITNDDLPDDSKKELDRLSIPFGTVKLLDLSKETPLNIDALTDDIRNMLFSKMNDADETLFDNFYIIKQNGGYTVFIGSSLDKKFMKNITKYISDAKKNIISMATSEEI